MAPTDIPTPSTLVERAPLHERMWLLEWCTNADCHGHYRPLNGLTNGIWACTVCATEITHTELTTADRFGDIFTTEDGALHRGIHPATLYTYTTPDSTQIFTVNDLYEHLRHEHRLPRQERGRTLSEVSAGGPVERALSRGSRAVITRNTP